MSHNLTESHRWLAAGLLTIATSLGCVALSGCERRERVLDVDAPGVDVEVDRNIDTGEVEVNATDRD